MGEAAEEKEVLERSTAALQKELQAEIDTSSRLRKDCATATTAVSAAHRETQKAQQAVDHQLREVKATHDDSLARLALDTSARVQGAEAARALAAEEARTMRTALRATNLAVDVSRHCIHHTGSSGGGSGGGGGDGDTSLALLFEAVGRSTLSLLGPSRVQQARLYIVDGGGARTLWTYVGGGGVQRVESPLDDTTPAGRVVSTGAPVCEGMLLHIQSIFSLYLV